MSVPSWTDGDGTLLVRGGLGSQSTLDGEDEGQAIVPGAHLGRYLVIEELGRGGMGVVLRAYDPKLEREVALKLLRKGALGDAAQARLVREARAMARLSHPNVVAVYDVELGSASDDAESLMLVMEYVPGTTLRQWLKDTSPSVREIVDAFVAAGRGLAAAHAEGVLHRDFKPDNVLVEPGGGGRGNGRVRVTDFGLARAVPAASERLDDDHDGRAGWDSWGSNDSGQSLTEAGKVMGTPPYMAPEQLSGGEGDARVDQYAFCVSLWEALTRRRPFEGRGAALAKAKRSSVQWPSDVSAPRHIVDALRRGLAPQPDDRWPTLGALLTELERDPRRRRRRAAGVMLLVAAPVVVWGFHRMIQARALASCAREGDRIAEIYDTARADEIAAAFEATEISFAADTWARSRARLDAYAGQWSDTRQQVCERADVEGTLSQSAARASRDCLDERADHLRALLELLAEPDDVTVRRTATATTSLPLVRTCTDEGWLRLRVEPPQDPAVREQLQAVRADLAQASAARATGRYAEGLRHAQDVLEQAEQVGWPPIVARVRLEVGEGQELVGHYEDAAAAFEQAFFEAATAGDDQLALDAATGLMFVLGYDLAQHERALLWGRLATMYAERLGLTDAYAGVRLHNSLGVIYHATGEYDRAEELFERGLRIKEERLGAEHPELANSLSNLALVHHTKGDYDQSLAYLQRALSIWESSLGPQHPHIAGLLHNIGGVHQSKGDYDEAIDYYERSLAIAEKGMGPDHRDTALPLNNIGLIHLERGHYEQARPYFERTLAILEKVLGPEHPDLAVPLDNLADVHRATGAYAEAFPLYQRALAILEKARGPSDPQLGRPLQSLAELHAANGNPAKAIPIFERVLEIRETNEAPPLELATTRFELARALWQTNTDRPRAHRLATSAQQTLQDLGPEATPTLTQVDAWLDEHDSP